jgi:hypothetical protein
MVNRSPQQPPLEADEVRKLASEVIDGKLKPIKWMIGGAATTLTALGAVGFGWEELRLFLFKKAYPADAVYSDLRVRVREDKDLRKEMRQDIVKLISERVDSGYTRTIFFGPGANSQPGHDLLQFYAREEQTIQLSLISQGSPEEDFIVTVDNTNIFKKFGQDNPRLGFKTFGMDITKCLEEKGENPLPGQGEARYMHTVKVRPRKKDGNVRASFELLVLVRNANLTTE